MFKEFNQRFGIKSSLEEEKLKFVERVITFLGQFTKKFLDFESYKGLFDTVCIQFGKNPKDLTISLGTYTSLSDLEDISGKDFYSILKLYTAVRAYYREDPRMISLFDDAIIPIIEKSDVDLLIRYSNGQFYPAKEKLLDKDLIDFSLSALSLYPNEEKDFGIALKYYTSNDKYGVVEYCYRCMEGLSRKILKNNRTLIDNKGDLLRKISAGDNWKKILANYIEYGNEYGRHASAKRHEITEKESEAYLYLTGLLIRLVIK
jgi:hypothetical protein